MLSELVKKENNKAEFTIRAEAEEFAEAVTLVYRRERFKFSVDGFRKGMAPQRIIEARYGAGVFFEDAINDLLEKGYAEALENLKLKAVGFPDVNFEGEKFQKGKGFTLTVKVELEPEIDIKNYLGIKIERKVNKVTDAMVDRAVESLRERNARLVSVDRPAKKGDTVLLDYKGFTEGTPFEGGSAENQSLVLGSGAFIPGFEEQLEGTSKGSKKDVNVTFPQDYNAKELAGKEAVFKCKIRDVKEKELPELNDEFAKDVSEFDTLDELKKDTLSRMKKEADTDARRGAEEEILSELIKANPFDVPEAMIAEETDFMTEGFARQISGQGIDLKNYLKYTNQTEEDMKRQFRPTAEREARRKILLRAVGKAMAIVLTDDEFRAEMERLAKIYNTNAEVLGRRYGKQGLERVRESFAFRKIMNFIYDKAEITDKEVDPEELLKEAEAKEAGEMPEAKAGEMPEAEAGEMPEAACEQPEAKADGQPEAKPEEKTEEKNE